MRIFFQKILLFWKIDNKFNKERLKTQGKNSGSGRHSPLTCPQVVLKKCLDYTFATDADLKRNERIHQLDRSFVAPSGITFTSIQEENAHNHEIAHTEIVEDVESVEQEDIEEPFQCSECDYKCHLVGDLKSHKATGHTFLSWWLTTKTSRRPDNHTTWSSLWQTRLKA